MNAAERRILAHAGVPADQVAEAERVSVEYVVEVRARFLRNAYDGQPVSRNAPAPDDDDV
jgi:hypothetical protein